MDNSLRAQLNHLVKEWVEDFWNTNDADNAQTIANRCLLPTCILHNFELGNRNDIMADKVLNVWKTSKSTFPDLVVKINELHFATCSKATSATVFARYTVTGTHTGSLHHIPASSRTFSFTGMVIDKIVKQSDQDNNNNNNYRISEEFNNFDGLGLLEELGYIPPFIYPLNPSIGVTSPRGEIMKRFPILLTTGKENNRSGNTTGGCEQSTGEQSTQIPPSSSSSSSTSGSNV